MQIRLNRKNRWNSALLEIVTLISHTPGSFLETVRDSDWGVPGIVVEQCARRKLFRAGTLDSNQRRRTLPLWILWCVMPSFHQRRGWGTHTPRQKTDERENNIFFTDHSSVRVLAVTHLKLCRIQAGRTRCGFSFRDQRLFYVPLLHWVWKFDIATCRV